MSDQVTHSVSICPFYVRLASENVGLGNGRSRLTPRDSDLYTIYWSKVDQLSSGYLVWNQVDNYIYQLFMVLLTYGYTVDTEFTVGGLNMKGKRKGAKASDNVVNILAYRRSVEYIKRRALDGSAEDQRLLAQLYWEQQRPNPFTADDVEGTRVRIRGALAEEPEGHHFAE